MESNDKNSSRNADWPPFPLPDRYKNNDPYLISAAIEAMGMIRRNYILGSSWNGEQYKYAIEIAFDIRSAWSNEGLVLPDIPQAKNINWPTEQNIFELEKWFRNAIILVRAEIDRYNATRTSDKTGDTTQATPETKQNTILAKCWKKIKAFLWKLYEKTIKAFFEAILNKYSPS
jgi:hypothetical protein